MKKIKLNGINLKIGNIEILKNINLEIKEKEKVAIIGPNGAGKTTLMNVILNMQNIKEGVFENDFLKLPAYKVGAQVQNGYLNGLMKVKEVLKLFQFEKNNNSFITKYNLEKDMDKLIYQLSVGEKQKVQLISMLQNNPEILLLDEITTGLDAQSRNQLIEDLNKEILEKEKTLIMITHYLEEAEQLCERFVFLKNGEIIEDGTKNELFKKYNISRSVKIAHVIPLDFTNFEVIDSVENSTVVKINHESEFFEILSLIEQNKRNILKYEIMEPSLERLYFEIIGGNVDEEVM